MIVFNGHKSKGLIALLIRWKTSSEINHVSVTFDDGVTYESTLFLGARRTTNPPKDVIKTETLNLNKEIEKKFRRYLESQLRKGYDFKAILGFLVNKKIENPNAVFCSEYAGKILDLLGFPSSKKLLSPKELLEALKSFKIGVNYGRG